MGQHPRRSATEKRGAFQRYAALSAFHSQTSGLVRCPAHSAFGLSPQTTGRNSFGNLTKFLRWLRHEVRRYFATHTNGEHSTGHTQNVIKDTNTAVTGVTAFVFADQRGTNAPKAARSNAHSTPPKTPCPIS